MGRETLHQPRLLQALSNLGLNTAREGAARAFLGNLGQGLTTLRVKNFFLISNLNLPSFSLKPNGTSEAWQLSHSLGPHSNSRAVIHLHTLRQKSLGQVFLLCLVGVDR